MRRTSLSLATLVLMSLATGCASKTRPDRAPENHAHSRQITAADCGTTVKASVGENLLFTFEENPSTGFQWEVRLEGDTLSGGDSQFHPGDNANGRMVGVPGTRAVSYHIESAGETTLTFTYLQAWQPEEPATICTIRILSN